MKYSHLIGKKVSVKKKDTAYTGIVIPSSIFLDENTITLKMSNGYNIGIAIEDESLITVLSDNNKSEFADQPENKEEPPEISLVTTGGTIASSVDYITGAVKPLVKGSEILSLFSELSEFKNVEIVSAFNILSENITHEHWETLSKTCYDLLKKGRKGIIVLHGTDTLSYSSSLLSFVIQNPDSPIVFVGAQRSIDRPSSDGRLNVFAAMSMINYVPRRDVLVAMHAGIDDTAIALHRGNKVRKMHSSRRDAFHTVNGLPYGYMSLYDKDADFKNFIGNYHYSPKIVGIEYEKKQAGKFTSWLRKGKEKKGMGFYPEFEKNVSMVWFYPGIEIEDLEYLKSKKGVVLIGTGLGHVNEKLVKFVKDLVKDGIYVVISSQTINGRINMNVYETGRELIKAGALSADIMPPEVAYTKLMWVLKNTDDIPSSFKEDVSGELSY
ncbi:MAG: Glu-tRNA(Gln) amidotransferase subunit GatD [Thermoplasmata archaeon]